MYKIQTIDNIAAAGLKQLPREGYEVGPQVSEPDAILVRSSSMQSYTPADSLQVVVRAGAGVNNIPSDRYAQLGIPVLNTPGANSNAVKELVIASMFMVSRHLQTACQYVQNLSGDDATLNANIEKNKKTFIGTELFGKTIGVLGLGNIGAKVANTAVHLGMRVLGYDTAITIKKARELSPEIEECSNLDTLISQSDFISIHLPLLPETTKLFNTERLRVAKTGVILLNFSRAEIVDEHALRVALDEKQVSAYVSDFPCGELKDHPQVLYFPHLGASTVEAEENCAVMAVKQMREYLEHGTIRNAVNFPSVELPFVTGSRLTVAHKNVKNMIAQISGKIGDAGLNILDLLNKGLGEVAYTVVDVEGKIPAGLVDALKTIPGVFKVRQLNGVSHV